MNKEHHLALGSREFAAPAIVAPDSPNGLAALVAGAIL